MFSVNEFLQKQADLQKENSNLINQNKIIQNKLNEASSRLNNRILVQGIQQEKVPKNNHAGFKNFVAKKVWKTIKYVNSESFANPMLIEKCYKALSINDDENKESFYLNIAKLVKEKLVNMRKHYRGVLKTLVLCKSIMCIQVYFGFCSETNKKTQLILKHTTDLLMKIFLSYAAQNQYLIVRRKRWNFGNGTVEKFCQLFVKFGVTLKSEQVK